MRNLIIPLCQAFVTRVPPRVCHVNHIVHTSISPSFVTGKEEIINSVKTYVATPTGDYPKDKAILFLPDVFGIELINSQVGHRSPRIHTVPSVDCGRS